MLSKEELITREGCFNMDCLLFLKGVSDGAIDCIITDPPYDVEFDQKISSDLMGYQKLAFTDSTPEYDPLSVEFHRTLKNGSYCLLWMAESQISKWVISMEKAGFIFNQLLVWEKDNTTMSMSPYRIHYAHEICLCFRKGSPMKLNKQLAGKGSILKHAIVRVPEQSASIKDEYKFHPAQKPINLLKDLVRIYTVPNDLVFDAFAGSGSTLFASVKLNRKAVGCEIDINYCNRINKNLREIVPEKMELQKTF